MKQLCGFLHADYKSHAAMRVSGLECEQVPFWHRHRPWGTAGTSMQETCQHTEWAMLGISCKSKEREVNYSYLQPILSDQINTWRLCCITKLSTYSKKKHLSFRIFKSGYDELTVCHQVYHHVWRGRKSSSNAPSMNSCIWNVGYIQARQTKAHPQVRNKRLIT